MTAEGRCALLLRRDSCAYACQVLMHKLTKSTELGISWGVKMSSSLSSFLFSDVCVLGFQMVKLKPKLREAHGVHLTLSRVPCPTPEPPHRSEQQAVQTGVLGADLTRAVSPVRMELRNMPPFPHCLSECPQDRHIDFFPLACLPPHHMFLHYASQVTLRSHATVLSKNSWNELLGNLKH